MKISFRQIRYFQAVADRLSFTAAARSLHMAQPPLSRQIKNLEEALGVVLFERTGHGIRLTEAGHFFRERTEQILKMLNETAEATNKIGQGKGYWFRVGFVPSVLYGELLKFITQVQGLDPQYEVGLLEMISLQQKEALHSGRISLGIGRLLFDDDGLERMVLKNEELVVALPNALSLTYGPVIEIAALAHLPLIIYPARPRPNYGDYVLSLLRQERVSFKRVQEVNELQTAIGLVAAGVGISIVPKSAQDLHREHVTYLPLASDSFRSPIILSWRKNDQSEFLKKVLDCAARFKCPTEKDNM